MNKNSELNIMVHDSDPHIIGMTKSWANKDIKLYLIDILITHTSIQSTVVMPRCPKW